MSKDKMPKGLSDINAQGLGNKDVNDKEGGNSGRGTFGQVYPTGVMATGDKSSKDRPKDKG